MEKNKAGESRRLAYLLRHDRCYDFDVHGWREVSELVANHGFTLDSLDEIVKNDEKMRYEYNADKSCVRACQGHSVCVDVELKEMRPPCELFHGTAGRNALSIMKYGIVKGKRLYVHLSESKDIAVVAGKRYGEPVVFKIYAKRMAEDGVEFYHSRNGVWLTEYVGAKYLELMADIK